MHRFSRAGRRATAMTFSAATFSQKLGGALAAAVIGWMLAAMGYVANEAQSDASQLGIALLLTVIPGMIAFAAALVMRVYPLDASTMAEVQDALDARRAERA